MSTGSNDPFVYSFGGHAPTILARPRVPLDVFTEDAFTGKLVAADGKPREVAPFPRVNPLTGPIAVAGARPGDLVAIHLISLRPARDWGVATVSPNFGALSGTRNNPNLQSPQEEKVWIWQVRESDGVVETRLASGQSLRVPLRPFHGIVAVAPPHGEVRLSVVPDAFGGNLDLPELRAGTTLYLRANVAEAHVYIGDGHYAQGDGELAGTAVEGALTTRLVFDLIAGGDSIEWPRIETDDEIGVVGCARPLEDAVRIAAAGLVDWVASLAALSRLDAYQLVTQACRLRIGALVNPLYTAAAFVEKRWLPAAPKAFSDAHEGLRRLARNRPA